jgi:hypothetical protein
MTTLALPAVGCRAPLRASRAAGASCSGASRSGARAAGRAGLRGFGSGSSELVAARFGTTAFGAGGAALRASVPQAAAGASGARGGALVRPARREPYVAHSLQCTPSRARLRLALRFSPPRRRR